MQVQTIHIFDIVSKKPSLGASGEPLLENYISKNNLHNKATVHDDVMTEYTALVGVSKYEEAFDYISKITFQIFDEAMKKDQVVCLMIDEPNSLGAALVCHFVLQKTKANIKNMRQYSAQAIIDMVKSRRLQTQIIR